MAVERCWELARPPSFDQLRDRRYALVAAGIVDTAIWDAVGKALGEPLWKPWGGATGRGCP
jgi:D-galactarolactone cycloisomerase